MAAIGQTITVVNKSGKIVSTTKHLANVFKEAKLAYRERKAELRASRETELALKRVEQAPTEQTKPRTQLHPPSTVSRRSSEHSSRVSERSSRASGRSSRASGRSSHASGHSSRDHSRHSVSSRPQRPPTERGYSDSFYINDTERPTYRFQRSPTSPLQYERTLAADLDRLELSRRHSFSDAQALQALSHRDKRESIDMDLAYGELPPPLPARHTAEENELRDKVTSLNRLLEEADCLQHSATAIINSLEKNPDTMAAVALTLAEISSLATKMAPSALLSLKGAFPAVIALLISPEFLIAAGVGVGITIVALGGYKIIKKIRSTKEIENEEDLPLNELEEVSQVDRIENWRRGIDMDAMSVATSVEAEFVTPKVSKMLKAESKEKKKKEEKRKAKSSSSRQESSKGQTPTEGKSDDKKGKSKEQKAIKAKEKPKEQSGLRMLFKKDKEIVIA